MAGMGPAPKAESAQRRKGRGLGSGGQVRLPAAGRAGDPPSWPLTRQSKREKALWLELWSKPQAVIWERLSWTHEVAMYVRLLVICERPKAPGIALIERRQQADRLGLTPMSMLRLRWEISDESTEISGDGQVIGIRSRMVAVE